MLRLSAERAKPPSIYPTPEPMKRTSPPEPLYTFQYPNLGYSIQIVPHTAADSAKIKQQAKSRHQTLRDYCQDEMITSLVLAEFE